MKLFSLRVKLSFKMMALAGSTNSDKAWVDSMLTTRLGKLELGNDILADSIIFDLSLSFFIIRVYRAGDSLYSSLVVLHWASLSRLKIRDSRDAVSSLYDSARTKHGVVLGFTVSKKRGIGHVLLPTSTNIVLVVGFLEFLQDPSFLTS